LGLFLVALRLTTVAIPLLPAIAIVIARRGNWSIPNDPGPWSKRLPHLFLSIFRRTANTEAAKPTVVQVLNISRTSIMKGASAQLNAALNRTHSAMLGLFAQLGRMNVATKLTTPGNSMVA